MTIFCGRSSTLVKLWDSFSPAKKKYINHARKYIWCVFVPSSKSTIDKVYLICVWQWSRFNWQDMPGVVQVKLTRYVWCMCGSIQIQSSRDKICLGWSKFNWQDASDISWLGMLTSWRSMPWQRFKLIRIQTLSRVFSVSPLKLFLLSNFLFLSLLPNWEKDCMLVHIYLLWKTALT